MAADDLKSIGDSELPPISYDQEMGGSQIKWNTEALF